MPSESQPAKANWIYQSQKYDNYCVLTTGIIHNNNNNNKKMKNNDDNNNNNKIKIKK